MKMRGLVLLLQIFFYTHCFSQTNANDIVGKWLVMPKQNLSIEVYKNGEKYNGKIIHAADSSKAKPGFIILENLKYNPKSGDWSDGTVHDPKSGRTYSATAKIKADKTLELHAYKGFKFLGTTKSFKRL